MMEDLYNNDTKFMAFLIKEICDYAVDNNMSPDDTIKTIATNLLTLLSISTFEHWQKEEEKKE